MLLQFVENVGDKTMSAISAIYELFKLSFICILHLPNPYSYKPAMRKTFLQQTYFIAVAPLPSFMIIAFIFGTIIIGMVIVVATKFNLQLQTGSIIVTVAIHEFAPLFTAFFLAFKSVTVISTQIAAMHINNRLKQIDDLHINIIDNLYLPHIISGILSTVLLASLFALIMISSGYIFSLFYLNMNLHAYIYLILNAMEVRDIMVLLLKSTAFGFVTMLIVTYSELKTLQTDISIQKSVLSGMLRLFMAILSIEVLSFVIQLM